MITKFCDIRKFYLSFRVSLLIFKSLTTFTFLFLTIPVFIFFNFSSVFERSLHRLDLHLNSIFPCSSNSPISYLPFNMAYSFDFLYYTRKEKTSSISDVIDTSNKDVTNFSFLICVDLDVSLSVQCVTPSNLYISDVQLMDH